MKDRVTLRDLLAANRIFILLVGLVGLIIGSIIGAGKSVTDAAPDDWYSIRSLLLHGTIVAGIVLGFCGVFFFPNPSWQAEVQQQGTTNRATMGCGCSILAGALAWLLVVGISIAASKLIQTRFDGWDGGIKGAIIGGGLGLAIAVVVNILHFWVSLLFSKDR